jgi:hypothetical protein
MDAWTLVQTFIPLVLALIFSIISIPSLKELIENKAKSVFTPVWCFLAGIFWFFFAIVNIYGSTIDYMSTFSFIYVGIGFLFMALFVYAIILNIQLSSEQKSSYENEMKLE